MSPNFLVLLKDRAHMLSEVRAFFKNRYVLEVDCPALSPAAPIDLHIDVMTVDTGDSTGFLHTSPEYGMKRLLAKGSGDIYQLSHVFRSGETGPLHNPEFMMIEWYRLGFSFEQMIEETLECIRLFLGEIPEKRMSYKQLIKHFLNTDYETALPSELFKIGCEKGLGLPPEAEKWDKDTLLQALIGFVIEPQLGQDHLFVLTHFPASQAALSQTRELESGEKVALRFEVYYKGIELANGYHELTDAQEQRRRLEESNQKRIAAGKLKLPIDHLFLEALEKGLPDCCGVAVGFDRLLQLKHQLPTLQSALPL